MAKRTIEGYRPGEPYGICDVCGFKNRHSQMTMTWNGMKVCNPQCYDPKPAFLAKLPKFPNEGKPVRNPRPEQPERFIDTTLPPNIEDL